MAKEVEIKKAKLVKILSGGTIYNTKIYDKDGKDVTKKLGITDINIHIGLNKINTAVLTLINVDLDIGMIVNKIKEKDKE